MPTLGAEPTRTEPNRAGPPGGGRGCLIARSRKISFAKKRSVSSKPNAYSFALHFLKRGKCVGHSNFACSCTLQRASRLHKTDFFDKVNFPTSVSSTPNAHLKIKCRLVYTECSLFKKHDVSSTPNTYLGKRIRRLAETRMLISGETMGNAVCKLASHLRRTPIVKKRHFPPSVSSTPE